MAGTLHICAFTTDPLEGGRVSPHELDEDLVERFAVGTTEAQRDGVLDDYQSEEHPDAAGLLALHDAMAAGYEPFVGKIRRVDIPVKADDEYIESTDGETTYGLSWKSYDDARKQIGLYLLECAVGGS